MYYFERKELKYYIPNEQMEPLRASILKHMRYDPYCESMDQKMYHVRSIYLDTREFMFFHEKLAGTKIRKKLRIRTYNQPEGTNSKAFFEIKRKIDNTVFKERAVIPLKETEKLSNGAQIHLSDKSSFQEKTALKKFIFLTKSLNLVPNTLITYEREAFQGIDDPDVRLTFDINVRSYLNPRFEEIYREEDLKTLCDEFFILEVKFSGTMPFWTKQIVRDFRLSSQSISKYCNALQECLPALALEG